MKIEDLEAWAEDAANHKTMSISVPLRHFDALVRVAREAQEEYAMFGARTVLKKALDDLEAIE